MLNSLQEIKQALHSLMNGPISQSLRSKGLKYRVIYGVEVLRLQELAAEIPHEYATALALWHEDIRECRLLATMTMPKDQFSETEADVWASELRYSEEAHYFIMHLICGCNYASEKAFQWIAHDSEMLQLCGLLLANRLLVNGSQFSSRDESELINQATSLLESPRLEVRKSALNTLLRLREASLLCQRQVDSILKRRGL